MNSNNNKIESAHQMYRDGKYEEALEYYTLALSFAKSNPQKIALHSNRAACFLKLHLFKKAAEECTSVLELDYEHTGALMLRAQTLVTLKEYHSALFDVNRLIELNPSSEVYQDLEARLKTQLSLAPIPEAEIELEEEEEEEDYDEENNEEDNKDEECASLGEDNKDEECTSLGGHNKDEECASSGVEDNHSDSLKGPVPKNEVTNPKDFKSGITAAPQTESLREAIPKPKGHSRLGYSRSDKVEDDSSEDDDDDDEDSQPQYRFRVKNIGVRVHMLDQDYDGPFESAIATLREFRSSGYHCGNINGCQMVQSPILVSFEAFIAAALSCYVFRACIYKKRTTAADKEIRAEATSLPSKHTTSTAVRAGKRKKAAAG